MINLSSYYENVKSIADKFGYEEQSLQLIEEMAELTQAINKHRRYNNCGKFIGRNDLNE